MILFATKLSWRCILFAAQSLSFASRVFDSSFDSRTWCRRVVQSSISMPDVPWMLQVCSRNLDAALPSNQLELSSLQDVGRSIWSNLFLRDWQSRSISIVQFTTGIPFWQHRLVLAWSRTAFLLEATKAGGKYVAICGNILLIPFPFDHCLIFLSSRFVLFWLACWSAAVCISSCLWLG